MNIYIYGAGTKGKELHEIINLYNQQNFGIVGYVDQEKVGSIFDIPIFRLDEIKDYNITIIIAINSFKIAQHVFFELKDSGFSDIWWFKEKKRFFGKDFFYEQCICCRAWQKNMIEHMEMHVMDACNLNCKGCAHFSPIFENVVPDMASRVADIKMFMEKGIHPVQFNLLGGEPFLNPELGEIAKKVRTILPDTDIVIVTNGLLIPKADASVLTLIAESNVKVSISEYEPTHKIIDVICDKLDCFGIVYEIRSFGTKEKFNKPLSINEAESSKRLCISYGCITLWNGMIARCPTLMYIDAFNKRFGTKLPNDGVMQLSSCSKGEELLEQLEQEVPLCSHCIRNEIEWGVCDKTILCSDFAV